MVGRLALAGVAAAVVLTAPAGAAPTAFCGPNDKAEPGLQGQTPLADMATGRSQDPYYCGLRIVGHNDVLNRGANWQLARVGDCAYLATLKYLMFAPNDPATTREPSGVAVIDARNAADPKLVEILRTPGAIDAVETMDAVDAGARKVLAAGSYAGGIAGSTGGPTAPATDAAVDIYDVSGDCTHPKLRSTFYWPGNAHTVTVSPDGNRVYGPDALTGGVMVLDIRDMEKPKLVGEYLLEYPNGGATSCHTVHFNADETRMYCAGDLSDDRGSGPGPSIWDVSDFSRGVADPQIRFVGEGDVAGQGNHHAVPATINGRPHIVAANELAFNGCASAAFPRVFDISDETKPKLVGEFRLEVQDHCSDPNVEQENAAGHYASHYNQVDQHFDTKLGLFGMTGAGFRVVDLRTPSAPREIAYFKPGANPGTTLQNGGAHWTKLYYNDAVTDACGGYGQYNPRRQHIWISCQSNGFFIAELSPEARAHMGMGAAPAAAAPQPSSARAPRCRTSVRLKLRLPRGRRASRARVYVNGRRARTVRLRRGRADLTLRRLGAGRARVTVLAGRATGRRLVLHDRLYRICPR